MAPAGAASRHPDAPAEVQAAPVMREIAITMRDGTILKGDLYRPAGEGRWPVIIEATPYGKRSALAFTNEAGFWPAKGYAFLIVDVRGQHASGGTFTLLGDGMTDGFDMVEWAAGQSWSDGRIGMRGASYSGTYPWLVARARPPHLRCISANASVSNPFIGPPYMGGALMQEWALDWVGHYATPQQPADKRPDYTALLGRRPLLTADEASYGTSLPVYRQILAHPTMDGFWAASTLESQDYAAIDIPVLAFSGWFDGTLPGTVRHHRAMRRHSRAAGDQFLVIGPWDHATATDGGWLLDTGERKRRIGVLNLPDTAFLPGQRIAVTFFDWCLKDGPRPQMPNVLTWITGADRWQSLPDLPEPGANALSLHLDAGARLSPVLPTERSAARYIHDPAHPVPSIIDTPDGKQPMTAPINLAPLRGRPDVLAYTSDPLPRPITVLGSVILELHAASSARDTDFIGWLEDVAPDGTAMKLGAGLGVIRARYRQGFDREVPLPPGRPQHYRIEMGEIGHRLAAGHRLRLSLSSSAWPLLSVNPGTGNPIATDRTKPVKARQRILHGPGQDSRLLIPVFDGQ